MTTRNSILQYPAITTFLKQLAKVASKDDTQHLASFSFLDKELARGENYYRLLQYDNDDRFTDLGMKYLFFDFNAKWCIY